jgi:hypothetical protein
MPMRIEGGGSMRIVGAKYYHDSDRFYSQENNPTEAYNRATVDDRHVILESCGPTSAVNCIAALGLSVEITCPGDYKPQPEEVLLDCMNDPRNEAALKKIRDLGDLNIPENRVPQYYPYAVKLVFGVSARFEWGFKWSTITGYLKRGLPVQLTLKKPGHYIAVVAYDTLTNELIFNDSWGSRFSDGKGGFNRRLSKHEFETNVQPYMIVYGVE